MPSTDELIRTAVAGLIATAIPASNAEARKTAILREGESIPRIIVTCNFSSSEVGHNEPEHRLNCFYSLYVFIYTYSSGAVSGDETIRGWREIIKKILFGPTLTGVNVVDDISTGSLARSIRALPKSVRPQVTPGTDVEGMAFSVETYESLT